MEEVSTNYSIQNFSITYHSCPKQVVIGKYFLPKFDDKIVNSNHQTTIFHWNWKEILRFVGFITWLTQPIQPKLVEISVGVPPALQQTSIFLFSFNEKWLYGDHISWIYFSELLGIFFPVNTSSGQLWNVWEIYIVLDKDIIARFRRIKNKYIPCYI